MANFCISKVTITHENKSKVRGLYHVSSGDIFNFILPPPVERCNEDTLLNKEYNIEQFQKETLMQLSDEERKSYSSIFRDGLDLYFKAHIERRKVLSEFGQ